MCVWFKQQQAPTSHGRVPSVTSPKAPYHTKPSLGHYTRAHLTHHSFNSTHILPPSLDEASACVFISYRRR